MHTDEVKPQRSADILVRSNVRPPTRPISWLKTSWWRTD